MCILEITKKILLRCCGNKNEQFNISFYDKKYFSIEFKKFSDGVDRFMYSGKIDDRFIIDSWIFFNNIAALMEDVRLDLEKMHVNNFYLHDDFEQLFSNLNLYSDLKYLSKFSKEINIMHMYYILLHDDILKCFACDFRDCNFYFWGNRLFMLYSKVLNDIHSLSNRELSKEDRDVLLNGIFDNLNKLSELCYSIFERFKYFLDFSKSKKSLKHKELVRMIFAGKR